MQSEKLTKHFQCLLLFINEFSKRLERKPHFLIHIYIQSIFEYSLNLTDSILTQNFYCFLALGLKVLYPLSQPDAMTIRHGCDTNRV